MNIPKGYQYEGSISDVFAWILSDSQESDRETYGVRFQSACRDSGQSGCAGEVLQSVKHQES